MNKPLIAIGIISATVAFSSSHSFSLSGSSPTVSTKTKCKAGYSYNKKRKKCLRGVVKKSKRCKANYVYSRSSKKCIRKWSQIIPDADLKEQGWELAYAGNYEAAIDLFAHVAAPNDPEALNGLGYSHRKLGKLQQGIGFYQKALRINPDYILAREYLGEGYVAAGRINLAKLQLSEIKKRCGTSCREYTILASVIKSDATRTW